MRRRRSEEVEELEGGWYLRVGHHFLNSFIQLPRVDLGTSTMWGPDTFLGWWGDDGDAGYGDDVAGGRPPEVLHVAEEGDGLQGLAQPHLVR